jgi:predicted lipid-binding transport protein (Tim44 family)
MGEVGQYLLLAVLFTIVAVLEDLAWARQRRPAGVGRSALPSADPLQSICRLDHRRDEEELLEALLGRSRLLLSGFADGQIATLRRLMSPEVYAVLLAAAEARTAMRWPPPELHDARIVAAEIGADTATLRLEFAADPVPAPDLPPRDTPRTATDIWTYERPMTGSHPEWLLVGTEPLS